MSWSFQVDGRLFSRAWRAVSLAAATGKDAPPELQTVSILELPDGFVLSAGDGLWIARAFVDRDPYAEPPDYLSLPWLLEDVEEAADDDSPWRVVLDVDRRVRDLMGYVERRTRGKDGVALLLRIESSDRARSVDEPPLLGDEVAPLEVEFSVAGEEVVFAIESELHPSPVPKLSGPGSEMNATMSPALMGKVCAAAQVAGADGLWVHRLGPVMTWSAPGDVFAGGLLALRSDEVSS